MHEFTCFMCNTYDDNTPSYTIESNNEINNVCEKCLSAMRKFNTNINILFLNLVIY
jgi:hypothetical protein